MGYRMEYGGDVTKPRGGTVVNKRKRLVIPVVIILMIIGGIVLRRSETVRNVLLPGDPERTASALDDFSENVKDGMRIPDAFGVFCEDILSNDA